jgi:hypothetical protein
VSHSPCPFCDSTDIADFEWTEETHPDCEWQWRCNACGHPFKDGDYERMVERQRQMDQEAAATPRTAPPGPECPKCGGADTRAIVYGLVGHAILVEAHRGDVVLGGCVVVGDDPAYACRACGHRFGSRDEQIAKSRAER